jgi:hypothetical protein
MTKRSSSPSEQIAAMHDAAQRAIDCADTACLSGAQATAAAKRMGGERPPMPPQRPAPAAAAPPDTTQRFGSLALAGSRR